jgi:hypothetical protein
LHGLSLRSRFFPASTPAFAQTLYATAEKAAARYTSPVVWLNTKKRIYHVPRSKDYGMTKDGA